MIQRKRVCKYCAKKSIEPKSDAFSDETFCVSIAYVQLLQT